MRIPAMVPPYDTRGLISVCFLAGCACGVASALVPASAWNWLYNAGYLLGGAVALLPFVALGMALAFLCRRRLVVIAAGASVLAGQALSSSLLVWTLYHEQMLGTRELFVGLMWGTTIVPCIFGVLVLLVHQASRHLIFRVFEGTPTTCRRCSYDAATERAPVCPECGTPIEPGRFKFPVLHRLLARVRPHARSLRLASLVIITILLGAAVLIGEMSPARAFLRQFRGRGVVMTSLIYKTGAAFKEPSSWGPGVFIRTSDGASTVVGVGYLPRDQDGFPPMQLQLHTEMPGIGFGMGAGYMSQRIFSDLDRAQAEWVVQHGLPQGLIDAMVAAYGAGSPSNPNPIYVDPSPFIGDRPTR